MSSTHAGRENKILGLAATALTHRRTQIHTQTLQFSKGKSIRDFFPPVPWWGARLREKACCIRYRVVIARRFTNFSETSAVHLSLPVHPMEKSDLAGPTHHPRPRRGEQPRLAAAALPGGAGPTGEGTMGTSISTDLTRGTFGSVPPVSTAYRGIAYRVTWCLRWPKIHWTVTTTHHDNGSEFVCHPFSHGRTSRWSAGTQDYCRLDRGGSPKESITKPKPRERRGTGAGGHPEAGHVRPAASAGGSGGSRGWLLLEPGFLFPGCQHGPSGGRGSGRGKPPPFPAASGRAQALPWGSRATPAPCPPLGPLVWSWPPGGACPLAGAEAWVGMKPFGLGSGSGCPWLLLGSAVSWAAWGCWAFPPWDSSFKLCDSTQRSGHGTDLSPFISSSLWARGNSRVDIVQGQSFPLSRSPLLLWTSASAASLSLPSLFLLPQPFSAHISVAPHFPWASPQSTYTPQTCCLISCLSHAVCYICTPQWHPRVSPWQQKEFHCSVTLKWSLCVGFDFGAFFFC